MDELRRTRAELHKAIDMARDELTELDNLPSDDFEIGTVLQFVQGEVVWLARKTEEKDSEGNYLWSDFACNILNNYERLYPMKVHGLQLFIMQPKLLWEALKVAEVQEMHVPVTENNVRYTSVEVLP